MKCLVCGASGFLGRCVVKVLAENGCGGAALDIQTASVSGLARDRFRFIPFDLTRPTVIGESFDAVVYLSHKFTWDPAAVPTPSSLKDQISINISGIFSLLSSIEKTSQIIYSSSVFVYPWRNQENISEETPPAPFSLYGWEKLTTEKYLEAYCCRHGISLTVLRFTQLYGPGDPHGQFITRMLTDALEGRAVSVYGGGEDARDILYVEDAARAVLLAVQKKRSATFNISSGKAVDLKTCGRLCLELAGRDPSELVYLPRKTDAMKISYSCQKASAALGFRPAVDLRGGLHEVARALAK